MRISCIFAFSCALSAANFTTYLGDVSATYTVAAIAADSTGNTYVSGARNNYSGNSGTDIFVSKIDTGGNVTLLASFGFVPFSTAGKPTGVVNAIAVDSNGNIFVAGYTPPLQDFPLVNPLQNTPATNGPFTGFLVKLGPDGSVLFSTYLGGTQGPSEMSAVAVDSQGNVYVTGSTSASDYPHTPGLPDDGVSFSDLSGVSAAWFAKISSDGGKILYAGGISSSQHACGTGSTCFLSGIGNGGVGIAVDSAGNAYVAGNAYGSLNGTTGAAVVSGIGAFVAKVNAVGSGLVYLTMIGSANSLPPGGPAPGSSPANLVFSIAADAAGNAYIGGETSDPNFPATQGSFQTTPPVAVGANPLLPRPNSGFVAKISPSGSTFVWATYLGGSSNDVVNQIVVDSNGNAWISGTTNSANFPISTGWPNGGEFLAEFNSSGSALAYGGRFPSGMVAQSIAFDGTGALHTAGATGLVSSFSPPWSPFESAAPQIFGVTNAAGGSLSGRVSPGEVISIYGLNLGPATGVSAQLNAQGMVPTTLAGVQVMIGGYAAPLLYVSSTQINAVAPVELTLDSIVEINLTVNGTAAPAFRTVVDAEPPQVFAAVMNQDGTINSASNPATAGSFVTVWASGAGTFSSVDGQVASGARRTAPAPCSMNR